MQTTEQTTLNRTIQPDIIDAVHLKIQLPSYEKYILSNGVEVYAFNMGTQDTLMLNWVFNAGNWFERKRQVATATNFLLKNGTSTKNAFALNEHFEYYGSYLNRHSYHETAEITLHCLSKHVEELLPVVSEMISDAIFPADELSIYKTNMKQKLQVNLKKNEFVAHRMIEAYLFGENHPYGRYSKEQDYDELNREDLLGFYKNFYQGGEAVILAAGILPKDLYQMLENNFGKLTLQPRKNDISQQIIEPSNEKNHQINVQTDGVQASIRIARLFPNRLHPDFPKMQVLNNVLGGFFGSRLMNNIREEKGYTYGIHSFLLNNIQNSALLISTEVGKQVCEPAINEIYKEIRLLQEEPMQEEELMLTRNYLLGTILSELDGPFQVAARWKNYILNGLTADYFYNSLNIIKTITPEELQLLAGKYLNADEFYQVVVT